MKSIKSNSRKQVILFLVVLTGLFFSLALEWWTRKCGFIMTPDSDNYLSAANSFKTSGVFLSSDGTAFTNWPPLFPMLLSLFKDPLEAMVWINIICKIFIAHYVLWLANRYLHSFFLKIIFSAVIFSGIHLLLISVFLWSEIIFMVLLLAHTCAALDVLEKRFNYIILFVTGFLLCVQRNAGLFWVIGTALWLLTDKTSSGWKQHVTIMLYVVVSVSGLLAWHFYNLIHMSDSAFHQRPFFTSILKNIQLISQSLGKAFFPSAGMLATGIGISIALGLLYFWIKYFRANRSIYLLVICIVIYTLGFLPVPNLDFHDMERYFAVIFPLFLLFLMIIVQFLLERYPSGSMLIRLCLVLWLIYPVWRVGQNALLWQRMSCIRQAVK